MLSCFQVKELRQEGTFNVDGVNVRIWRGVVEGLSTVFLEPENGYFWVGTIYGRNDDAQRFGFFSHIALQVRGGGHCNLFCTPIW